jgi:CHAD domain-containing protein
MAAPPEELEWQLDAQDLRPVLRWIEASAGAGGVAIAAGHTLSQVDTYLDTADRRLDRAGYTVRLRRVRGRPPEATLKSLGSDGPAADGLRIRLELEERLDTEDPGAVALGNGPVGSRVRALVGSRGLVPLFDVQTRRRVFPLAAEGAPSGELVLDDTAIREPGGRILSRLRRVEVEAPADARALVEPLVESLRSACGLHPALLSKYESGLVAAGVPRQTTETFGRTEVEPGDTIGQVGLAVLRRHFATMLAKEPGTRLGDDIEELHDMRVASRRMRAALALFADELPAGAAVLRAELAWVGQEIGVVRDLDVQLEQLDGWIEELPEPDRAPLARLRALLAQERAGARREMLAALDSARYDRFVRRFGTMLRTRTGSRTPPALAVAPDLVERRHRALRKAARRTGPGAEPAAYHRARIAGKRFRYALEFVGDLYPGATKELVRRTVVLQDLLGAYQDADVAIERLRGLAADRGRELGPATVFAMGEIAERYRQGMDDIRGRSDAAFARLEGKPWKQFRRALEASRPPAPPPAAA